MSLCCSSTHDGDFSDEADNAGGTSDYVAASAGSDGGGGGGTQPCRQWWQFFFGDLCQWLINSCRTKETNWFDILPGVIGKA